MLAIILPLITTPYISRVLGPDKIGQYSYTYSIAYYFVMFILLGLNNYGNRTIAMLKNDKKKLSKAFYGIYFMQLINGFFMIFIYCVYTLLFSNNLMTWILLIYVVSGVLDINWFFFGMEQFKLTVVRNTIIKLITTLSIFIMVKNESDIYLYSLIMVGGMLLSQILLWPFVRKFVDFCRIEMKDIIRHIKPNLTLFIPVIAISLYKVMDKIMLGLMASMIEVGYYESSEKIIAIPMALITSLGTVMLPKMSNLIANNNEKESKKYFSNSIMLAMFLSTSLCFGVMGVSNEFVPIFYGYGYSKCIILFQILLPSCMFLAFANVVRTQYIIPRQLDSIYIKSVILGAIINLFINLLLIPVYQSIGAAIGTLCAEATVCIYQIIVVRNKLLIKQYLMDSSKFLLAGLIMYLILMNIPTFFSSIFVQLLFKVVLGAIVYLFIIGLFFRKIIINSIFE